ncbi:MAG: T9SS type A sorting domain-containing protein [Flavobacterium sp.]|nr:T9SS type A sorting domain-containing protein [Flavobacterium sp.]
MVINISNSSATPQDHFRVYNNGSFIETAFRMFIKLNGFDFQVGIAKEGSGNAIVYAPNLLSFESDHLIILKFKQLPGTNDDFIAVYYNPNYLAGQPANPDAFNNSLANASFTDQSGNIRMMAFRQNSNTNLPTGKTGLISVSNTWEGLGFLPLSNQQFNSNNFLINSSQINSGKLLINSNVKIDDAIVSIFDLQGRVISQQITTLNQSENEIAKNPISTIGDYILEFNSDKGKYSQKILVQ